MRRMQFRRERVRVETQRHIIEGTLQLPHEGYRSRTTDYLNAHDSDFIALIDADVTLGRRLARARAPGLPGDLGAPHHPRHRARVAGRGRGAEPRARASRPAPSPRRAASSASATAASTSAVSSTPAVASASTASPASVAWTNPWSTSTPTTSAAARALSSAEAELARRDASPARRRARAACGLRQLDRGLRVGARLDLGADDHHHLRRQEPLRRQPAAGLAHGLAQARRPHVLDEQRRARARRAPISSVRRRRSSSAKPAVR